MTLEDRFKTNIRSQAFTLIELLVVIAIIAILVSLTLAAGTKVVSVGKERGTQWALQALDNSMGEYIQANGAIPSPTVKDPLDSTKKVPIVDGLVNAPAGPAAMDSVAWYVYQLQAEGSSALAAVHQIDPRLRKTSIAAGTGAGVSDVSNTGARTTHILDVWGNPIRYVHPRFAGTHHGALATDLGDVTNVLAGNASDYKFTSFFRDGKTAWAKDDKGIWRLATKDEATDKVGTPVSDGGTPPNRRPYFYSAGPDGDPSTIDDNVYTVRPSFPR